MSTLACIVTNCMDFAVVVYSGNSLCEDHFNEVRMLEVKS